MHIYSIPWVTRCSAGLFTIGYKVVSCCWQFIRVRELIKAFMMIHMHYLSFPITGMVHVDILSRGGQHFIETVLSIHTGRACSFQRFANNHTTTMLFNFFETRVYHYPEKIMQLTNAFVSVYTFSVVIGVVWYDVLAYFVIIFTMGM